MERLDQIVVGPRLQALDLLLPSAPRGQDEDRKGFSLLTQPTDDVYARELWQPDVDDPQIDRILAPEIQALVPIRSRIHGESLVAELPAQTFPECLFVFDQ